MRTRSLADETAVSKEQEHEVEALPPKPEVDNNLTSTPERGLSQVGKEIDMFSYFSTLQPESFQCTVLSHERNGTEVLSRHQVNKDRTRATIHKSFVLNLCDAVQSPIVSVQCQDPQIVDDQSVQGCLE